MLKLGFDIDEVISHLTPLLSEYLNNKWNINFDFNTINIADLYNIKFSDDHELSKKIAKDLIKTANNPYFQNNAKPIENACNIINKWKEKGNEIYFVTSRPISKIGYTETQIWLHENGFEYDFLYHTGHYIEKGIVVNELELDFFVEDRIKHVNSITKYCKYPLRKGIVILERPWNQKKPNDSLLQQNRIIRCKDWNEIDKHLEEFGE